MSAITSAIDRCMAKVDKTAGQAPEIDPELGPCWLWTGCVNAEGYGRVRLDGTTRNAHRAVYELLVGSIPDGLELDHLCVVTRCVNPAHMEPVTGAENRRRAKARRTHCKNGHPWDGDHVTISNRGHRVCLLCTRETDRRRDPARTIARRLARQRSAV